MDPTRPRDDGPAPQDRLIRRLKRRVRRLERSLADAEERSRTDPLTGLANRRRADEWLREMIEHAASEAAPLSCILADLDGFKAINDTYGHPVGDLALIGTAKVLTEALRPADRIARLGGEEFLVLLPGTDAASAVVVAERLRRALADLVVPPRRGGLASSFGVAGLRPAETGQELVQRADAALLRAKRLGRDRVESEA